MRTSRSPLATLVAGGIPALLILAVAATSDAGPTPIRRLRRAPTAEVLRVDTPLGTQGTEGVGPNVVIPFVLHDPSNRMANVQVQYAIDRNGDGAITNDEFWPAREDRLDPRNTRQNRRPQLYSTTGAEGAMHAFVWAAWLDLPRERALVAPPVRTDQGRVIPDPANPADILYAWLHQGVRVRIRPMIRRQGRIIGGDWVESGPFELDNDAAPSVRIDGAAPRFPEGGPVRVDVAWTVSDDDSEDADEDGVFDPGEDTNGNRLFDREQVGVAFDCHMLAQGEDPATMTDAQLASLSWRPCTRAAGEGDTDSFRQPGPVAGAQDLRVFASPGGRSWTFVWDPARDAELSGTYILRARAIDARESVSEFAYFRTPITLSEAR